MNSRQPGGSERDTGPSLSEAIREHLELRAQGSKHRRRSSTGEGRSSATGPDARPPSFLFGEVVRVAAVTGDETDDLGRVIDATPFLGREAVVQGATPTAERDGWMIHLDVDEFGAIRHFPQGALMRTGWIEVVDEHGAVDQVPLDPTRHRPWRDDVMLELELEASRERTKAIAEMSLDTIRGLTGSGSIDYRVAESQGGRQSATFWAYFDDGALDAFERLIGLADSGWRHDQDDSIYVCSRWERAPGHPPFISPEVRSAELTYRRWLSPERGSQRD